jgi:hypothetical protein
MYKRFLLLLYCYKFDVRWKGYSLLLFLNSRSFLISPTNLDPCSPFTFHWSISSSPLWTPPYSLLSSLLRDVFLNIHDKTPWTRDQFIARPLQSVQSVSSFGLLRVYSRGVLNPHKDKWQHDSLDGGSHHHKASNSTRQHINLSTNTHLSGGFLIVFTVCKRHTAVSPRSAMCVSIKRKTPN